MKTVKSKVQTNLEAAVNSMKNLTNSNLVVGSPSLKQSSSFSAVDRKKTFEALGNSISNIPEEDEEDREKKNVKLDILDRSQIQIQNPITQNGKEDLYMDQDVLGEDEDRDIVTAKNTNKASEYRIRTNIGKSILLIYLIILKLFFFLFLVKI